MVSLFKRSKSEPEAEPQPAPELSPAQQMSVSRNRAFSDCTRAFIDGALRDPDQLARFRAEAHRRIQAELSECAEMVMASDPTMKRNDAKKLAQPRHSLSWTMGNLIGDEAQQIALGVVESILPMTAPANPNAVPQPEPSRETVEQPAEAAVA